jgi:hypothetical protein
MSTPEEQTAAMIENLHATTGRGLADWTSVVVASGLEKHDQIVAMLKVDHGLTYGYANLIALAFLRGGTMAGDDETLRDARYAGPKAPLRPILERVLDAVRAFGPDVADRSSSRSSSRRRRRGWISASTCGAPSRRVASSWPPACARTGSDRRAPTKWTPSWSPG